MKLYLYSGMYLEKVARHFLLYIIAYLALQVLPVAGQYQPIYSLRSLDPFMSHVSYSAINKQWGVTGIYRDQWVNVAGAPSAQYLHFFVPHKTRSLSFGLQFERDQSGLERHVRLQPTMASSWDTEHFILSIGVKPQFRFFNLQGALIRTPEGKYISGGIDHRDPNLPTIDQNLFTADLGLSLYVRSIIGDLGISMDNILASSASNPFLGWQEMRFINISYSKSFELMRFKLMPGLHAYSDFVQWQSEISFDFDYNGSIFGGVLVRVPGEAAMAVKLGFPLVKNIFLGYAYDFSLGKNFPGTRNGSHEIMIQYRLGSKGGWSKPASIEYNPRYYD